ncbi:DNA polymerase III subunit beta [Desulfonatronovibrio magnus]|uniref:DNA polymerase III subunit beta n=1 Tax=Desulfonatronovibrio magnus TaxID=698827 RepID=UPI0005EBE91D|nr:DNA polymerase III subunit beta [Desulfonatronovibrio magnus]
MYLRVFKEDIIEGILRCTSVISQKTGPAYLRTLWLSADDERLNIMGTDGNIEFTGSYNANVLEKGLVGVEGKKIGDLIRKLKPGEIIIRADNENNVLSIQQDKRRYKIPTTESSWFPDLDEFPEENKVLWSGEILKEIVDKTLFCIGEDESMGTITMLKVAKGDPEYSVVECCAFDNQNMSIYSFKNEDIFNLIPEEGFLISRKYIMELKKWLTNHEIEVNITTDRLFIRSEQIKESISFPLSFGTYTDYNEILKTFVSKINSRIIVNRKEFLETLDRLYIFTTDYNRAIMLQLSPQEMTITSTAVETGEASESISCDFNGDIKELIFNIRSLMDILNHFSSDDVHLNLSEETLPCKVTSENEKNFFVITVPVQIEEEEYYTEEEDN